MSNRRNNNNNPASDTDESEVSSEGEVLRESEEGAPLIEAVSDSDSVSSMFDIDGDTLEEGGFTGSSMNDADFDNSFVEKEKESNNQRRGGESEDEEEEVQQRLFSD